MDPIRWNKHDCAGMQNNGFGARTRELTAALIDRANGKCGMAMLLVANAAFTSAAAFSKRNRGIAPEPCSGFHETHCMP